MEQAARRNSDPNVFFPARGGSTEEAKKVCRECPVRSECLDHAIANRETQGVWGSMSVRERRLEIQRRVCAARLNAVIG